jgi:hypothetical protein
MEVVATPDETSGLLTMYAGEPYRLFPEERQLPIRMTGQLPVRTMPRVDVHDVIIVGPA